MVQKRYKTKPFGKGILENYELREEEQKTSSPLAFLRPLLREASEKSRSFTRNITNVSGLTFMRLLFRQPIQKRDRGKLQRTRTRRRRRRRTVQAAHVHVRQ